MITIRQWRSDSPKSVASRFLWRDFSDVLETFYTCHDQNNRIKKYVGFTYDHYKNITSAYILIIEE